MTGGGFGGSIVALVDANRAASFAAAVTSAYSERSGKAGVSRVCATVDGAAAGPEGVTSGGAPGARSARGRAR